MIGQYLPNKTKVVLFIRLKFFHNLNVALAWLNCRVIVSPALSGMSIARLIL
jgi:hypothetical protein